jgi:uncharacterized YigZ family protein
MSERFALAAPARLAQEIRKSKFVANAANATSEPVALDFLREVADPAATHNCWAWRIGQRYRFNDDGEPSGTAGKPILQAIDGQQFDGVVVVVTRWFGGIKLGAGGLVRAYGGCAAECLRTSAKVPIVTIARAQFTVEFAVLAVLRARLAALEAVVEAEDFTADGVNLRASFPAQRGDELRRLLADLTRGRATLRMLDDDH